APYLPGNVLLVNLLGSFALGVVFVLADQAGLLRAGARLFVAVGLLGGFTTFSTFGWGAAVLVSHGQGVAAALYIAASVVGGLLAVILGIVVARKTVGVLELSALALLQRLNAQGRRRYHDIRVDMGSIEAENRPVDAARTHLQNHPVTMSSGQVAEHQ
ncbi:MAG: fluoride efflux transporter FluC, partial [Chloroflexota bacterium]